MKLQDTQDEYIQTRTPITHLPRHDDLPAKSLLVIIRLLLLLNRHPTQPLLDREVAKDQASDQGKPFH